MKFLSDPSKEIYSSQRRCNRGTQAQQLLKRLKKILKGIGLGDCHTFDDRISERVSVGTVFKEMFLDFGGFLLEPDQCQMAAAPRKL